MTPNRTFRLFISSTFSDFIPEREALQNKVFPELERFCAEQGARFQAVDLRWGITEEAQLEHETMRICLEEVRHSQLLSPRPNFAVLLGDRYGWEPVPPRIPVSHWERIIQAVTDDDAKLIHRGYKGPDTNSIPAVYHLHKRSGNWDACATEENLLLAALRRGAEAAGFQGNDRLPYFASATHQEIALGALLTEDAQDHVHVYVRRLEGLPQDESARNFIDWDPKNIKPVPGARDRLGELEVELTNRLLSHVHPLKTNWTLHGKDGAVDEAYLNEFCELFLEHQKSLIESEISSLDQSDETSERNRAHLEFGTNRSKVFAGREELLTHIHDYTESGNADTSVHPLVLIGFGGSGKSALLAKAARSDQEKGSGAVIVQRYIGGVPGTESLMTLLSGLAQDISRIYGQPDPGGAESATQLAQVFLKVLAYSSPERPLHLYLDALDQLESKDSAWMLEWLPAEIPVYSRIVASLRAETTVEQSARMKFKNLLEVPPMNAKDGRSMLSAWLADKQSAWFNAGIAPSLGRQLTPKQTQAVLQAFGENGSALWLKLAYEEASTWTSWDDSRQLPTSVEGLIHELIENRLFKRENHPKVFTERALAYLTAGRFGLSEVELGRALGADDLVREEFVAHEKTQVKWGSSKLLPPIMWSRLFFDLQPYLGLAEVDGAIVMRWFHREFAESLKAKYLSTLALRTVIHGALADVFKELDLVLRPTELNDDILFRSTVAGGKQISASLRRVMEQPWQLSMASRYDDLKMLLTDFGFCMGKCACNQIDDLLENYDAIKSYQGFKEESSVWMDFMYANAHILRRGVKSWPAHKILLQLATEHADDSSITQSAESWLRLECCDWVWMRNRTRPKHAKGDSLIAVMEGHTDTVYGIKLLPDGRILSWGDRTLRIWDGESGLLLSTLEGHKRHVLGAQTLNSGELLSWSQDGRINLWDLDNEALIAQGEVGGFGITSAQVGPDGRLLLWSHRQLSVWDGKSCQQIASMWGHHQDVSGANFLTNEHLLSWSRNSLHVWNSENGSPISVMEGTPQSVSKAQMLKNGRILSWGGTALRLWDAETGSAFAVLQGHTNFIWNVLELSKSQLVSWSSDNTLRLWDSVKGEEVAVLLGHSDRIWDVEVLPDGRLLSWSADTTLRLWDASSGVLLVVMKGHTDSIAGVKLLSNGRILSWAAGQDKSLRLWDGSNGDSLAVMQAHLNAIQGVDVLQNGHIFSWSSEKICVWDMVSDQSLAMMLGQKGSIGGVQLLPNGHILSWSGGHPSDEKGLHLWDGDNGHLLAEMYGLDSHISDVLVLKNNRVISWAGDLLTTDHTIRLWDMELGKPIALMQGHTGLVLGVMQLPTGALLSWSSDGTLRLWNDQSGESLFIFEGHSSGISGVQLLPNGRIVSWSLDKTLRLWDCESGQLIAEMADHTCAVEKIKVVGEKRVISWASGYSDNEKNSDKSLRLWDADSGALIAVMSGHSETIRGVEVLGDGRVLTWSGREGFRDKTVRLWNGESGAEISVMDQTGWWTVDGALSLYDGQALTWGGKTLRLWDLNCSEVLNVMQGHTGSILGAQLIDDRKLLSWSSDNSLRIWDIKSGATLLVLQADAGVVLGAKSLSGGRLVSWSVDGTLRVWDTSSGAQIALLEGHIDRVHGVMELSTNRLLSWSADSTLRLWDSHSGVPIALLEGHKSAVLGAQLLSESQILSWSSDKTLRLWDCHRVTSMADRVGHTHRISSVKVIPGNRLLSWAQDKTLRLWDAKSGKAISEMKGHKKFIRDAKFLPDERVLSWSDDQTLRLWDAKSGATTAILDGHPGNILDAQLLADGTLQSWSDDGTILFWNGKTGTPLSSKLSTAESDDGYFLPDAQALSWDEHNNLRFWDTESGATINLIEEDTEYVPQGYYSRSDAVDDGAIGYIVFAKVLPNDRVLVAYSVGTLYLWDAKNGNLLSVMEGHQGMVDDAQVIESGECLLSWAEDDYSLRLWSIESGSQLMASPAFWIDSVHYPSPWEDMSAVAGAYRYAEHWAQGTSETISISNRKLGLHVQWQGESLRLFGLMGTTAIAVSGRQILFLEMMNIKRKDIH